MRTFFKIWAFLMGGQVVWLRDHDGTVTLTVAYENGFGLYAKRRWPFNIRNVQLGDGGKVLNGVYVVEWKKA